MIRKNSVRARILAVALVPALVLVVVVATYSALRIDRTLRDRSWAAEILESTPHAVAFAETVFEERRLTLQWVAGRPVNRSDLDAQRRRLDAIAANLIGTLHSLVSINPGAIDSVLADFEEYATALPSVRAGADAGRLGIDEVYQFFDRVTRSTTAGLEAMVRNAPKVGDAVAAATTSSLFRAAAAMSGAHALAAASPAGEAMPIGRLRECVRQIGVYHSELDSVAREAATPTGHGLGAIVSSPSWSRILAVEDAIIDHATPALTETSTSADADDGSIDTSVEEEATWQSAVIRAGADLVALWGSHYRDVQQQVKAAADRAVRESVVAGGSAVLAAVVALLIAVRMSDQLSRRLYRLRAETLTAADEKLPAIMAAVPDGGTTSIGDPIRVSDTDDEIDQVASAFNRAYTAAVRTAITEAKTRESVNAVFLNIAHRSQLMMRRLLELLDRAESHEEDPATLGLLFQLDHLATRELRNAENLIILGGRRPGRQWRTPVPMLDLARGAVAEAHDYTRVDVGRLPQVRVIGAVAADIIHLIAELIDNATSFSPPTSRVEVAGHPVGRGVVVEVADHGLGLPADELDRVNTTLSGPPDFGLLELSTDSRVGIIVVAVLAARHGIKVRLTGSDSGGIRATVLVPDALLAPTPERDHPGPVPAVAPPERSRPPLPRRARHSSQPAPTTSVQARVAGFDPVPAPFAHRSPEQARALMAAIDRGTRYGRRTPASKFAPHTRGGEEGNDRYGDDAR